MKRIIAWLFGVFGGLLLTWFLFGVLTLTSLPFKGVRGHWYAVSRKFWDGHIGTHSFWIFLCLFTVVSAAVLFSYLNDWFSYDHSTNGGSIERGISLVLVLAAFGGLAFTFVHGLLADKADAQFYNRSLYFTVEDLDNLPPSLSRLAQGGTRIDEYDSPFGTTRAIVGTHDVPGVIVEQPLDEEGWQPRNNSYLTAVKQMSRTSGNDPRSNLLEDTVNYFPGETTSSGYWTGIRDGKGRGSHIKGIVYWTGRSELAETRCSFEGQYALNKALEGSMGNSFNHWLYNEVPADWWYNLEDVYGYCDGDKPIIVMPMLRYRNYNGVAQPIPADVLLITGSPSGDAVIERLRSVDAGELPGPVYPISLARAQRTNADWAAGRRWKNQEFGYDPSNAGTQSGNESEYLLRSNADGRLYWVTPLTPGHSDSQLTIAISIVPADEVASGRLNIARLHVLDDGDVRINDFARLKSNVMTAIGQVDPSFVAEEGNHLEEFLPGTPGQWSAFAVDASNIPRYFIEVTGGDNGVVIIRNGESFREIRRVQFGSGNATDGEDAGEGTNGGETTVDACANDLSILDDAALVQCLEQVTAEISDRLEAADS